MLESFQTCLKITLGHEGGFSDHEADAGGATNFGITLANFQDWRKDQGGEPATVADLKAITLDEVERFYCGRYWNAAGCHMYPAAVALVMFDGAVHHGPGTMVKLLQEGLIGLGQAPGPVDGVLGRKTRAALARVDPIAVADELVAQRLELMMKLCAKKPTQTVFALGWSRRMLKLQLQARKLGELELRAAR